MTCRFEDAREKRGLMLQIFEIDANDIDVDYFIENCFDTSK